MAKNKFYTVTKKIDGVEYVAQFNGLSSWLKAVDTSYVEGTNNTSVEELGKYILENVIVEPKGLTIDDFETMAAFNKVVKFGSEVAQGNFREETADEGADKKKS